MREKGFSNRFIIRVEKKTNEIVDVIVQKMYLFETWKFERERERHTQCDK